MESLRQEASDRDEGRSQIVQVAGVLGRGWARSADRGGLGLAGVLSAVRGTRTVDAPAGLEMEGPECRLRLDWAHKVAFVQALR